MLDESNSLYEATISLVTEDTMYVRDVVSVHRDNDWVIFQTLKTVISLPKDSVIYMAVKAQEPLQDELEDQTIH